METNIDSNMECYLHLLGANMKFWQSLNSICLSVCNRIISKTGHFSKKQIIYSSTLEGVGGEWLGLVTGSETGSDEKLM